MQQQGGGEVIRLPRVFSANERDTFRQVLIEFSKKRSAKLGAVLTPYTLSKYIDACSGEEINPVVLKDFIEGKRNTNNKDVAKIADFLSLVEGGKWIARTGYISDFSRDYAGILLNVLRDGKTKKKPNFITRDTKIVAKPQQKIQLKIELTVISEDLFQCIMYSDLEERDGAASERSVGYVLVHGLVAHGLVRNLDVKCGYIMGVHPIDGGYRTMVHTLRGDRNSEVFELECENRPWRK
jgi:hypothetical protein